MNEKKKSTDIVQVDGDPGQHRFGPLLRQIIDDYAALTAEIDAWFDRCLAEHPEIIACSAGCHGCCRGLFDITLLDAFHLQAGFSRLPEEIRERLVAAADQRMAQLRDQWPELAHPFLLNGRPEEDWAALMPEDDETPCILLDSSGRCLVYEHRPMTCRLHGLPLVDRSGEVMEDSWCTKNFTAADPLGMTGLRGDFDRWFRREVRLGRALSQLLFGEVIYELDTIIPAALLIRTGEIALQDLPNRKAPP